MKPTRRLNRRSFLASVGAGFALIAPAAGAQNPKRCPLDDSDSGVRADIPPGGRAVSDSDAGANADPACRRPRRRRGNARGCSDTDSGTQADPAGQGRRCDPSPRR